MILTNSPHGSTLTEITLPAEAFGVQLKTVDQTFSSDEESSTSECQIQTESVPLSSSCNLSRSDSVAKTSSDIKNTSGGGQSESPFESTITDQREIQPGSSTNSYSYTSEYCADKNSTVITFNYADGYSDNLFSSATADQLEVVPGSSRSSYSFSSDFGTEVGKGNTSGGENHDTEEESVPVIFTFEREEEATTNDDRRGVQLAENLIYQPRDFCFHLWTLAGKHSLAQSALVELMNLLRGVQELQELKRLPKTFLGLHNRLHLFDIPLKYGQ